MSRRLVFHIGGYDPMSARTAHHRFTREIVRFRSTWGVAAEVGPLSTGDDSARWHVKTAGRGWTVDTEVRWLRWEDVMARLERLSMSRRLTLGLLALADFTAGGAFRSYMRQNWRYALFFIYPVVLLTFFVIVSIMAEHLTARLTDSLLMGISIAVLTFICILQLARYRLRLDHILDDWIFAREQIRHPDEVLSDRLDRIAEEVAAAVAASEFQEVLVIGHSLGAVLAVEVVDRALTRTYLLGRRGASFGLATVGSSIPKIGFHRGAWRLRDMLGRVGETTALSWVDYQAYADVMNFHKFHPVRGLHAGVRGPLVRLVSIPKMLDPDYYRRIRTNLLRIHNQFVSGNDLRAIYDYFMLICGPCTLQVLSRAPEGAADCVGADGSILERSGPPYVARPGLDVLC